MLLKFTFKNFKSFKDENTLDMRAMEVEESDYHIREVCNEKILPIVAIYGANASGKSNVIQALRYMKMCVIGSVIFNSDFNKEVNKELSIFSNDINFIYYNYNYNDRIKFSFIDDEEANSSFEVIFINNNKRYKYGFIRDKDGFKEEWLKEITLDNEFKDIFVRENYELKTYTPNKTTQKKMIETSLKNTSLILSLGAMLNIDFLIEIRSWFSKLCVVDFSNPLGDNMISRSIVSEELITGKLKNIFLNYLSSFDDSIVDYFIEEYMENERKRYKVYTKHKIIGSDELKKIKLAEESSGTQKMAALFNYFYNVIKNGDILIIDELNAKLHPLLVRLILGMFSDPDTNPNNAQIIFTTHDAWLMEANILRPDEIWFTEKNKLGVSELYSLVDFQDAKNDNYQKSYLSGEYGAIPDLALINFLGKNSE